MVEFMTHCMVPTLKIPPCLEIPLGPKPKKASPITHIFLMQAADVQKKWSNVPSSPLEIRAEDEDRSMYNIIIG